MRVIDETGNRYGRLTVIERSSSVRGAAAWLCQCDCGNTTVVIGTLLRKEDGTRSCGCLSVEHLVAMNSTHGHASSLNGYSPTYMSWLAMRDRCYRPTTRSYEHYGGRGIRVCDRWRNSFENFLADMGERPEGMTLDRIDSDGDYTPGNCRWADSITQRANQRSAS